MDIVKYPNSLSIGRGKMTLERLKINLQTYPCMRFSHHLPSFVYKKTLYTIVQVRWAFKISLILFSLVCFFVLSMATWAFTSSDKVLWAWVAVNVTIFIFILMFFHIYYLGKRKSRDYRLKSLKVSNISLANMSSFNDDYVVFDRLRLLSCCVLLCYSIWPLQYYLSDLQSWERLLIVACSSLADFGVTIIIAVIAHRTFKSYHKIVNGNNVIPKYYNIILFTFVVINGLVSCVIEILSYGFVKKFLFFDTVYNDFAYVYISIEMILFIVLFRFLLKIANIFSKIYKYERDKSTKFVKTDAV